MTEAVATDQIHSLVRYEFIESHDLKAPQEPLHGLLFRSVPATDKQFQLSDSADASCRQGHLPLQEINRIGQSSGSIN